MPIYYVDPTNGNDADDGLSWANAFLTLNGAEDEPVAAGDIVYVGPGVYRETLTCDVSGGNTYSAGTVTVTNGSTTVTGAGTAFLANVAAGALFHVAIYASGGDGVANGTATFTSAAGNFQANMIGKTIQINTRAAYGIGAVAAANSITLTDPNGLGWPAAAGGLTYSVMSGETHYEIDSVTDNTNFELVRAWCGPTLTGLTYITFDAITYIADVSGENTDGVGGVVRITGSDNDQTAARTRFIDGDGDDYRRFRGFWFDTAINQGVFGLNLVHWIIEDCVVTDVASDAGIYPRKNCENWTVRRCVVTNCLYGVRIEDPDALRDDRGHVLENLILITNGFSHAVRFVKVGGITLRNCLWYGTGAALKVGTSPTTGQTIVANNCNLQNCTSGFDAVALGEITEDYNNIFLNNTHRVNTAIGANSVTFTPLLRPPLLLNGYKFPWWFGELSEWSQVAAIAGIFEACDDLRGIARPVTASKNSWGPVQFNDMERETGTVRTGSVSMAIHDAGRHQIWVPVTNVSTTISVYVYREANYAGNNPQMIIKQPDQADDVTTDAAAASQWNLLTTTLTPAALPPYVIVELVSRNTNGANDRVFFDDLVVN